ncbi:Serum amyloid P-component [Platysternon megacephalum]|uniref:Serum amyloid P-component n=1 Tax=Platysternon megacephalum TaxID=55544 RepID=A0A4D9DPN5_9SAUR|nr:Serum amyloid P-component [Platysternon megacephalum]
MELAEPRDLWGYAGLGGARVAPRGSAGPMGGGSVLARAPRSVPQEGDSPSASLAGWRGPKEEACCASGAQHPWVWVRGPRGIAGVWSCLCRPHPLQRDEGLAISQAASRLPRLRAQLPHPAVPRAPWAPSPARELGRGSPELAWGPRGRVCPCSAPRAPSAPQQGRVPFS